MRIDGILFSHTIVVDILSHVSHNRFSQIFTSPVARECNSFCDVDYLERVTFLFRRIGHIW